MKLTSYGGHSGNKKCYRCYIDEYAGVCVWRESGVWSLKSDGRFFVVAFGRSLDLIAMKIFSYLTYFIKLVLSVQLKKIYSNKPHYC
jgi:hypothetical protein